MWHLTIFIKKANNIIFNFITKSSMKSISILLFCLTDSTFYIYAIKENQIEEYSEYKESNLMLVLKDKQYQIIQIGLPTLLVI